MKLQTNIPDEYLEELRNYFDPRAQMSNYELVQEILWRVINGRRSKQDPKLPPLTREQIVGSRGKRKPTQQNVSS